MGKSDDDDKPKKAFQIKMTIWDDGAVDCDVREYRKLGTGRGAPTLCGPLMPNEFMSALKGYGVNAAGVSSTIKCELALDTVNKLFDKKSDPVTLDVQPTSTKDTTPSTEEDQQTKQSDDFGLPEGLNFDDIEIDGEKND